MAKTWYPERGERGHTHLSASQAGCGATSLPPSHLTGRGSDERRIPTRLSTSFPLSLPLSSPGLLVKLAEERPTDALTRLVSADAYALPLGLLHTGPSWTGIIPADDDCRRLRRAYEFWTGMSVGVMYCLGSDKIMRFARSCI